MIYNPSSYLTKSSSFQLAPTISINHVCPTQLVIHPQFVDPSKMHKTWCEHLINAKISNPRRSIDMMSENKNSHDVPNVPLDFKNLITPKDAIYLSKKLSGDNAQVMDYALRCYSDEKIGFLGSHFGLVIKTNTKSADKSNDTVVSSSISLFVKALPYDVPTQAEYIREKGVFDQESNFFNNVVPELTKNFNVEPWAPDCHLIKHDCLVFEDLRQTGFAMSDKLFDTEKLKSGLAAIARFHAASLHAEKRLNRRLNELFPRAFVERAFVDRGNQYRWYRAGVDCAVKIAENLQLDATMIPSACERVFRAIEPSRTKQNVASHGDLWSNNLLFDHSQPPRCRMVDFQLLRYAPLGHDVAQFIHLCASRKFRDSHTIEMIDFYYEKLCDCLKLHSKIFVRVPAFSEVVCAYEEQKLGAVVTAVMYFPTVLLDGRVGARIMNDSASYEKFVMHDRRDVVVENMMIDVDYRCRIEETVRELVEYSHALERLPVPC